MPTMKAWRATNGVIILPPLYLPTAEGDAGSIDHARGDYDHVRNCGPTASGNPASGPVGARLWREAALWRAGSDATGRPNRAAWRQRARAGCRDERLQLRLCVTADPRRRYRHRGSLFAR